MISFKSPSQIAKDIKKKLTGTLEKLADTAKKNLERVGKNLEKQVITTIKKEGEQAVSSVKNTFERELPKQLERGLSELEKKVKQAFESEFKKQIVKRLIGVGKVGVKHGGALNELIPTSELTLSFEVAGTGISFSWEGQYHIARVFDATKKLLDAEKFSNTTATKLLLDVLPHAMTVSVGGTVTPSALVIGTDIALNASFTVEKDEIRSTIRSLPRILTTLSQMPNDVLKTVILNK